MISCSLLARSAALTPRSLTIPDHSLLLITCSPITCLLPPNYLVPGLLMSNFLPDCLITPINPVFGQTCSPISLSLPPTQSLVLCLPHTNTHPCTSLHTFRQATFDLDILWNIHLILQQSTDKKTKGAVMTAPGAFASAWSEASIYENNHISASFADFLMSVI